MEGKKVWEQDYYPFGSDFDRAASLENEVDTQSYKFTGKENVKIGC